MLLPHANKYDVRLLAFLSIILHFPTSTINVVAVRLQFLCPDLHELTDAVPLTRTVPTVRFAAL